jgi:cardiolipin synthase
MIAKQFTILPPMEFISDVREEVKTAEKRLYLQAMEVEPGEISSHLLQTLEETSKRGLETRLHVDYYSLLVTDGLFNYLPLFSRKKTKKRSKRLQKRTSYFDMLQNLGVTVTYTNPPSFLQKIIPIMGRNHIKIAVVDDVAYIGGINFHDENFKSNDCMVKLTDPSLVDAIVAVFRDIEKGRLKGDLWIGFKDATKLFIDGGKVGKSIILDKVAELITLAQSSVKVITPIIPDTKLLSSLSKAKKRGLTIQVIVPSITKMQGVYFFLDLFNELLIFLQRKNLQLTVLNHPIHAKMIVIDDSTVLLGSHNFTSRGVVLGTEEIAIQSSDTYFVSQARLFISQVLSKKN